MLVTAEFIEDKYLKDGWQAAEAEWPEAARLAFRSIDKEGVPTAVLKTEELGWVVIQSSGQGPYLLWSERPQPD